MRFAAGQSGFLNETVVIGGYGNFGARICRALSVDAGILVGLCWLPVVWIQIVLRTEAARVSTVEALLPQFHRRFQWWFALGVPAFMAMVLLFYLMVASCR